MSKIDIEIKKQKQESEKITDDEQFEKEMEESVIDKSKIKEMVAKRGNKVVSVIEKQDRALNWFVVGCGQGGSRLAETFCDNGYEAIAINTAEQDLKFINLPEGNKLLIKYALDGAAKDILLGEEAFNSYITDIEKFVSEKIPKDTDMIVLAITGGGGTGSGSTYPMIHALKKYEIPLVVLYVLPLESDDVTSKNNSLVTLSKLAKMAKTDVINSLIVVDNAKIETLPYLKQGNFWVEANKIIVEPLHMFNMLSVCPSSYTSLDPMDEGKILTEGDCCIYGHVSVKDFMEETALAEAILNSLESGLLASGFDLKTTRKAGVMMLGTKDVLNSIPAVNINYAYAMLNEITNNATIYKGIYESDTGGDIKIYTVFSGLGLPKDRIDSLASETKDKMNVLTKKSEDRGVTMEMEYGDDTVKSDVQRIHEKIKQKNSAFSKLSNNAIKGKGIIDRRKR